MAVDKPERGLVQQIEDEALRYCVIVRMVAMRILEEMGGHPFIDIQSEKGRLRNAILRAIREKEPECLRLFLENQRREFQGTFNLPKCDLKWLN